MKKFPDDWSNLPDDDVRDNITYLSRHYRLRRITRPEKEKVCFRNVVIEQKDLKTSCGLCTHYIINGKAYSCESNIGNDLAWLMSAYKDAARPFKDKAKEVWQNNWALIVTLVVLGGLATCVGVYDSKKKAIDKKVSEYEKTLPGYLEQKQQVEEYRDSLWYGKKH